MARAKIITLYLNVTDESLLRVLWARAKITSLYLKVTLLSPLVVPVG